MRPTDEHQGPYSGSPKRPNLISSQRRGSGEINILAMLEGQTGRPLKRRLAALPVALWYGAAGVLVCTLIGVLAWLARAAGHPAPVQAERVAEPAHASAAPDPVPAAGPVLAADPVPANAAQPPAAPEPAHAVDAVPSEPAPVALIPAPTPAPTPAPASASVRPQPAARSAPPVHAAAAPHMPVRVAATPHPAAPAPHARRGQAGSRVKPAAPEADTDVALISAIIQHGAQRPAAGTDGCADRPCGPALQDQP